jgi:hypothetical protein
LQSWSNWVKSGENSWVASLQEDKETGEMILPFNEIMKSQNFEIGDILNFKDNKDGSYSITKKSAKETQWVLVECVSIFRTRYMVDGCY